MLTGRSLDSRWARRSSLYRAGHLPRERRRDSKQSRLAGFAGNSSRADGMRGVGWRGVPCLRGVGRSSEHYPYRVQQLPIRLVMSWLRSALCSGPVSRRSGCGPCAARGHGSDRVAGSCQAEELHSTRQAGGGWGDTPRWTPRGRGVMKGVPSIVRGYSMWAWRSRGWGRLNRRPSWLITAAWRPVWGRAREPLMEPSEGYWWRASTAKNTARGKQRTARAGVVSSLWAMA